MKRFRPVLGYVQLFAIAIGGTVSSTYFLGNGYLFHQLGPLAFLSFALGGLITYLTMNAMAELAANEHPTHLSFVEYSQKYLSPAVASGVGWSYWLNWVIYIPTECIAGGLLINAFIPSIPVMAFALFFALILTWIHLRPVKRFAEAAEFLTYTHMLIFAIFIILAFFIFMGWAGPEKKFLGTRYLLGDGGPFPNGFKVFLYNGVIMLLNFQGCEVVGLCASESKSPRKEVPFALKELAPTVTFLYVVPMFLLALIFPWRNVALEGSIFATALEHYGFKSIGAIFAVLIAAGSVSCINSGLYAAARSLHALSVLKMAPRYFKALSTSGVPLRSTLFTFAAIWIVLITIFLFPSAQLYSLIFVMAGIGGTFAWLAICLCHLVYRHRLKKAENAQLLSRAPFYPWGSIVAFCVMTATMGVVGWDVSLRPALYYGLACFILPYLGYKWIKRST